MCILITYKQTYVYRCSMQIRTSDVVAKLPLFEVTHYRSVISFTIRLFYSWYDFLRRWVDSRTSIDLETRKC